MKYAAALIAILTVTTVFCDDIPEKRSRITTEQIKHSEVLGRLGQPLGTCFRIRAKISVDQSNRKGSDGNYFLTVDEVEGKKLESPAQTEFAVHRFATERVKLANDDFGLYELRNGRKAGTLTHETFLELRKGYVDKIVNLVVYESGGFGGTPQNMPRGVRPWQGKAYCFEESLIVMDQIE